MYTNNNRFLLLSFILAAPLVAACQTTGGTSETTRANAPRPTVATAPVMIVGDTYRIAVTQSKSGSRDYVRTFDGIRDGLLVFLDHEGKEFALYSRDLNPVRIGGTEYTPDRGRLRFPMQVGNSWTQKYTQTSPVETRHREMRCSVKDWEPIEVMAGRFMAFRIQCTNQWSEATLPADEMYWYAPAVKFIVKYESTEWFYASELKSYEIKNKTALITPRDASAAKGR